MVKKIIALVMCVLVFFGMIALLIMINLDCSQKDTSEHSATVVNVAFRETGKNVSVNIYTKEYSTSLYISPDISKYLDVDALRKLKPGDKISFKLENMFEGELNNGLFVVLVSLKISGKDIFTLDDYNTYMSIETKPTRIACIVAIAVFFGLSVWCTVRIRKAIKSKKINK